MSNPSLIARLGLSTEDFTRGLNASQEGLKRLQNDAKVAAAQIALLEREMAGRGGGTSAQGEQHKRMIENLREIQKQSQAAAQQLRALEAIQGDGASGHGHGGGNKAQLAHSGRATLEMIMAGQSPLQAAQIEAPRIIQAFGGGLGTMLGVGAGIAVLNKAREQISETIAKAHELKNALIEALRPEASQGEAGGSALRAHAKELDAVIEEAAPKLGAMERMWQRAADGWSAGWVQMVRVARGKIGVGEYLTDSRPTGGYDSDHNAKSREDAEQRREETLAKIVKLERQSNTLKEDAFTNGEESVRAAELELEKKQKLAQIEEELGIPHAHAEIEKAKADLTSSDSVKAGQLAHMQEQLAIKQKHAAALQAEAEREYTIRQQEAARAEAAGRIAVETEGKILAIKQQGFDVEKLTAQVRLEAAQDLLKNGPKEGTQHARNQAAVAAAKLGVRDAARSDAQGQADLAGREDLAHFVGSDPERERKRLDDEKWRLEQRLQEGSETYEPDNLKRREVSTQLAENDAQHRALDRADQERAFRRQDNAVEANTRPGTKGKIDAIDAKLARNQDEATANAGGINDPDIASRLNKEAGELSRQKAELLRTEERTLRVTKEQTQEIELQQGGHTRAAHEAQIRASYEEQILAALQNQDTKLADQLAKKRDLDLLNARIERELQSPEERAAEDQHDRQRGAAAARVKNRDQRGAEAQEANNTGAGGSFDRRFHGKDSTPGVNVQVAVASPRLPNRIDDIHAGHANAGKDDSHTFNDKNIVSELRNVVTAVKNIALRNRP